MDDLDAEGVRLVRPFMAFTDEKILTKRLKTVMADSFGIPARETAAAAKKAWAELMKCKTEIREQGENTLRWIEETADTASFWPGGHITLIRASITAFPK